MKTSISTAWQFVQLIRDRYIAIYCANIVSVSRLEPMCAPIECMCVSLFFLFIVQWGKTPAGGWLPHTMGVLAPRMGQDASF